VRPSLILLLDPATHCSRREAERLARLLPAPDSLGNPQAPACRMGVEELIWDCGYIGLTKAGAARRTSFWSAAR
jgi:hypothetical protein